MQRFTHGCEVRYELPVIRSQTNKLPDFCSVFGSGYSLTARTFAESVAIPFSDTSCPRKATFLHSKLHFLGLSFRFTSRSLSKITLRFSKCSSNVLENTIMSSRYMSKMRKVASKYPLHQAFKNTRGVYQTKWQDSPLPQATAWDGESSFRPIFLCYAYLMKAAL